MIIILCVLQAIETPLSTFFRSLASVGVGFVIGFIYSWELTLLILCIAPLVFLGGYIQAKKRSNTDSKNCTELAGQVRIISNMSLIDYNKHLVLSQVL